MYQYVGALHRAKESKDIKHERLSNNIQHGRRNNNTRYAWFDQTLFTSTMKALRDFN